MSAESATLLRTSGLSRHFGGIKAVQDVSVTIEPGKITSLIGPNGAGKTTFFNLITGIFPPSSGKIELLDRDGGKMRDVTGAAVDAVCRLGIARTFQNIRLFTDLRVLDNVKLGLHTRTKATMFGTLLPTPAAVREEREAEVAAVHYLDFVGLLRFANDVADNLSYGDQRRLEIARALAANPTLLLLDEPAAGMNPQETADLMRLIRKIRDAGVTVCLIEHDVKLVMEISDYVYVLDHGELIASGTPATVREDPKVIEAYLGVDDEAEPGA